MIIFCGALEAMERRATDTTTLSAPPAAVRGGTGAAASSFGAVGYGGTSWCAECSRGSRLGQLPKRKPASKKNPPKPNVENSSKTCASCSGATKPSAITRLRKRRAFPLAWGAICLSKSPNTGHRRALLMPSLMRCGGAFVDIFSSGGGLGIHQPRSNESGSPLAGQPRPGRARIRAKCSAVTRSNSRQDSPQLGVARPSGFRKATCAALPVRRISRSRSSWRATILAEAA